MPRALLKACSGIPRLLSPGPAAEVFDRSKGFEWIGSKRRSLLQRAKSLTSSSL